MTHVTSKKEALLPSDLDKVDESIRELLTKPQVQFWRHLLGLKKNIFSYLEGELQKQGCTVARFQIMFFLYFEGPLAPTQIARKAVVSRGNITTFLRRMTEDQLVKPLNIPSTARPRYALTSKGKRMFRHILPEHIERICRLLPEDNLEPIIQDLKKLTAYVDEQMAKIQQEST